MANARKHWVGTLLVAGGVILGLALTVGAQTTPKDGATGFAVVEPPTKLINEKLAKSWSANKLEAAPRCDDHDYIRRATLDIIGRIATPEEIDRYMKDPENNRRALLVDRLLASSEYSDYWSTMWTHWLLSRQGNRIHHAQLRAWLEELFAQPSMSYKEMVIQLLTATGKTNENGAVNFILAHLGEPIPQQQQAEFGQFDMVPITSRTTRIFLGYQLQCAQCHYHPQNNDWKQEHFWGLNVFFRQVQRVGNPVMQQNQAMQQAPILELRDDGRLNQPGLVNYEKVKNGVFLTIGATYLNGRRPPREATITRRGMLAEYITSHKNFAPAFVNRMWGHFFGRGLGVKQAFDDFGEHNEIAHPEMLDKLAEHFQQGAYDPRKLIRWITASDAYNLKPVSNKTNDTMDADPHFSRGPIKMMSPEQLLESLLIATRPAAADRQFRDRWLGRLVRNFGDDEGNEATYNGTILQALLMMNSEEIKQSIERGGTMATAAKLKTGPEVLRYLFLATLNRPPSQKEYQQIVGKLALPRGLKDTAALAPMEDVFWALLNCGEFILNH